MSWLKLDDGIFYNRKIAQCGAGAKLLYIVSLTYCANQLTDGFIPDATLPLLAGMAGIEPEKAREFASDLLDVCLWSATGNGWQIPDFLEYNPSREQVLGKRKARSDAGKRGGEAKNRLNSSKNQANGEASPKQNASKSLPRTPSPSPYKRDEGLTNNRAKNPPRITEPALPHNGLDEAFGDAIKELEQLGMITGNTLIEFQSLWPELSDKKDWVTDAVRVAHAQGASSPAYAVRVLWNALKTGRRPGAPPPNKGSNKSSRSLDDIFDEVLSEYGDT